MGSNCGQSALVATTSQATITWASASTAAWALKHWSKPFLVGMIRLSGSVKLRWALGSTLGGSGTVNPRPDP